MDLLRRGRGIEHEYILATEPPLGIDENVKRRNLIAHAIESLGSEGFLHSHVRWGVEGEGGNFEYESSLLRLWPFETPAPCIARNGMRIYEDALHLEISTPVYASARDAVVYGKVSEYLAALAAKGAEARIGKDRVYCYNSNTALWKRKGGPYIAAACGTHGNIAVLRDAFNLSRLKEAQRALIAYLVCRIIITGSGGYLPCTLDERGRTVIRFGRGSQEAESTSELVGEDICFVISPRSHFVNCIASSDTTLKRGLINLRDEPHADAKSYWRFHDINWEGIRSHLQIYIRDVLHAFVLSAFELGYLDHAPILRDPLGDMKRISMDANMDWRVVVDDGRSVDAIREIIKEYYLARIETMLIEKKGSDDNWRAFKILSNFVNTIADRDLDSMIYCVDWVAKRALVEACSGSLEGVTACNQFCLVDQSPFNPKEIGDSLFDADACLAAYTRWVPECTSERIAEAIEKGLRRPPSDTREGKRMELIEAQRGKALQANWDFVVDEEGSEASFPDPLSAEYVLKGPRR